MRGLNEYIDTNIITQNGIVSISNVHIGDRVYDFHTGKMLEVKDVIESKCTDIMQVLYSDGRKEFKLHDDVLYGGKKELRPLEFNPDKVKDPLYPDPNIAGVLLIYGDYDSNEIKLPLDMDEINNLFAHNYNLDYGMITNRNTVNFSFNHSPNRFITWDEFFPHYDFYAKSKKITSSAVPNEYMYSSIKDRIQFIRGIFDVGYNKKRFPDSIGIEHWNEERLLLVQRMLWSLGVPSIVEYNPVYIDDDNMVREYQYDRKYHLKILGDKDSYPGFFYDINNLEYMIGKDSWERKLNPQWIFKIVNCKHYCHGYMKNIILEKPTWYYTADYLPRLSL